MGLAYTVKVGETVDIDHRDHGHIGSFRVDNKAGNVVRLIFNMPRSVLIRVLDHRASRTSFGLSGEPRGPVYDEGFEGLKRIPA